MDTFVIEVLSANLRHRTWINGIEVVADLSGKPRSAAAKVNSAVVMGTNRIVSELQAAEPGNDTHFTLRLVGGVHGTDPGEAGRLLEYDWDSTLQPLLPGFWVKVLDREITLDSPFGRWSWQDSPPGPLTDTDRVNLRAEISALHQAALARDTGQIVALHNFKIDETARALGVPRQELADDLAETLNTLFAAPDFSVTPLTIDALDLQTQAEGRLVRVTQMGGGPVLTLSGGESRLALQPLYSQPAGGWVMVR